MEVVEMLGWSAMVVTLCFFLTGIPLCRHMWSTSDTTTFPIITFLLTVVNTFFMADYGYRQGDNIIFWLNFCGVFLHIGYVSLFCFMEIRRNEFEAAIRFLLIGAITVTVYAYLHGVVDDQAQVTNIVGLIGSSVVAVLQMIPLMGAVQAWRSGLRLNADMLFTAMGLITAMLWTTYGLMLSDIYILAPSCPGVIGGVLSISMLLTQGEQRAKAE
ncbi:PREDICTED: sugar transporter SWEET1-like [Priapulus caudatus]|uniref:Sugar transporter SWEET1 n=1 Tax=Priapulus caudatus TaxID=37621 RepID=A0ABM1ESV5_PRICU|nr:PREDICTED: sugar transporter SWEET1-like [Priapulus caudatus]XP_014675276.1 PREDICTED: sugar transporter SWEET1-like [Priapulus caudatus]XP_014675277.1 PREDICTED: sugar transporter SWEET1-like [Priapulus caudatus]